MDVLNLLHEETLHSNGTFFYYYYYLNAGHTVSEHNLGKL